MKRTYVAAAAALALLAGCGSDDPAPTHHRTASASSASVAGRTVAPSPSAATTTIPAASDSTRPTTSLATEAGSTSSTGAAPAGTASASSAAPGAVRVKDNGTRTLSIPVLGVSAPVTGCATEDGTVTPPGDIRAVCRWTGSQDFGATTGTTIIVGHSTRSEASVGALEYVRELQVGDIATMAGQTWRVVEVLPGVDKHSLPAWIVDHTGPRQLGLVTCETTSRTRNDLARLVPVG